ncbi:MAG TPA: PaaI family thioesterase [Myxococcales bacterium]
MTEPIDAAPVLNENLDGWCRANGLRFTVATAEQVGAEWTIAEHHLQAYGIVHGGVHCGVIETLASVGAAVFASARGQTVVGLENHTSFIRAVRIGEKLAAEARPITRGKRTQVWEATVKNQAGEIVATGRVRLLCLEPGTVVAGEAPRGTVGKIPQGV